MLEYEYDDSGSKQGGMNLTMIIEKFKRIKKIGISMSALPVECKCTYFME